MNPLLLRSAESLTAWLADYFLLATILLATALVAFRLVRQPKRRILIAWVIAAELIALAAVCSLPNWPRIPLLPATSSAILTPLSPTSHDATTNVPATAKPPQHLTASSISANTTPPLAAAPLQMPSLRATIGIAYLLGMTATSLWLLWGAIATWRLCRNASPAHPALHAELANLVGDARPPRLLLSRQIADAAAVGLLQPTILLQTDLAQRQPSHALRSVLAHEWAHLRNHDLWLLAVDRALRMLLFAHPLYWQMRAQIRDDQEALADALAANIGRHEYAQNLLEFARLSIAPSPRPAFAAAGIMERPSQLSKRIAMLLDDTFHVQTSVSRRWTWPAATAFAILGISLSLLTLQPGVTRTAIAATTEPSNSAAQAITVRTVDAAGNPLAGVQIHASVWTNEPFKANRDYTSDAAGLTVVQLPKTLDILRLFTSKDDRVPTFTHWEKEWFTAGHQLPPDVTITLKNGTTIGGIIQNEEGHPIAGAKIAVAAFGLVSEERKLTSPDLWLATGGDDPVTDANGHWTLNDVPEDPNLQLTISVTHPDYISDVKWGGLQEEQHVTTASLRSQKAATVMHRGISLTGHVIDPQGHPVAGAIVIWGNDPYSEFGSQQEHRQEFRTDANGAYRFQPLPATPLTVTVVAPGWAPDLKTTTPAPESPTLDFQLKPGKTLKLRLIDDAGNPIPDVHVAIDGWRGRKSLYNIKNTLVFENHIPASTDKNGVYEWTFAPDDPVAFRFYKTGYKGIIKSITPQDLEQPIELSPDPKKDPASH